jgi:RimJ/RimL family protein N-acetyltransferase
MGTSVIETERLRLERETRDAVDLHAYYQVCSSDPGIDEVTEYLSWEPHDHPGETAEYLDSVEERWEDRENAGYLVRPKDPDAAPDVEHRVVLDDEYGPYAGSTGLGTDWDRRSAGLGLWLRKPFWGRGYSGERAAALLELAFERLDLEVVEVSHEVGNEKSRRAIEKYVDRFGGPASEASGTSSRAERSDGGRREGRLRNDVGAEDGPTDQVRYTSSREEYEANRPDELGVRFDP